MSGSQTKELRKQLRNVVQQILPEILTKELKSKIMSDIMKLVNSRLQDIEDMVRNQMTNMDERAKDVQSLIVRQVLGTGTVQVNENAGIDVSVEEKNNEGSQES